MTVYTKCIYHDPSPEDGIRIAVLGRLTENDGKTPVTDFIRGKHFDLWMPILAPSPKLVGSWHRKELTDWAEFTKQYLETIRNPAAAPIIRTVSQLGKNQDITLLCSEETHERCHRSLLAEECKRYESSLSIVHH